MKRMVFELGVQFPRFGGHLTAERFAWSGKMLLDAKTPPYSKEFKLRPCRVVNGHQAVVALERADGAAVGQGARPSQGSPRSWACQRGVDDGKAEGLSSAERDELRRLRRERSSQRSVRSQKRSGLLRLGEQDPVKVFKFVLARKAEHSIKLMCRAGGLAVELSRGRRAGRRGGRLPTPRSAPGSPTSTRPA